MISTNHTPRVLIHLLVLAGLLLAPLASVAQLPNAWRITDNSSAANSTLGYTNQLSASHLAAATNNGFSLTVHARFVTDFADTRTMNMSYNLGDQRFLVWWDLDSNGALTAELEGGATYTLTPNGTGSALYHTHEILYNTNNGTASYVFDGVVKTNNWPSSVTPVSSGRVPGRIRWGAGSDSGRGRVNYHSVNFSITGLGSVASYDAGTWGTIATAPDPVTQGWTLVPASPPADTAVTEISPDTNVVLAVERALANQFTRTNATIYALAYSTGSSNNLAWFEWGTDTNYGNVTPVQDLGVVQGFRSFFTKTANLVGGPDYHYRGVASNAFGIRYGGDGVFNLRFIRDTALPNPALPERGVGQHTSASLFHVTTSVADFDNDGRLDLLLTGRGPQLDPHRFSELWRNLGDGRFTNVTSLVAPTLTGVEGRSVWGDYDNDGRLDLLLAGRTNGPTSGDSVQVWHNTSNGFTNVPIPGLQPNLLEYLVWLAWSDYDNDGRLDFLISSPVGSAFQLWRNTGSGFINVPVPGIPACCVGQVAWGDYDNDGRSDFLALKHGGVNFPILWRNTANGFAPVSIPDLPGIGYSSAAWGDYDSDGRLDFLIAGQTNFASNPPDASQVWRNTGNGFTQVPVPGLAGADNGQVTWGDYDNDGRLDFLITGTTNGDFEGSLSRPSQLWRNTGSGFTAVALPNHATDEAGPVGFDLGSAVLADCNNDGRLDILLSGRYKSSGGAYYYGPRLFLSNLTVASNQPPAAPAGLSATISGSRVALHWDAPSDDSTLPDGLSYNVRIGTTPGGRDIASPPALPDGRLLVPQMGAARNGSSAFYDLPPGRTYYWSVQAVDNGFAGSPFATEQQFSTPPVLIQAVMLGNGSFQFSFTNQSSVIYEVLGTTNVSLPVAQWTVLGLPASLGGGLYQFTDALAPNQAQRFYLLRAQ